MCKTLTKELSPEELRSVAKLFDSQNLAVAVNWVAQRPVMTLDPAQRLMNFIGLSLKWRIKLHPFLYWFHSRNPARHSEQEFEGKSDLELCLMAMDNGETLDLDSLAPEWRELWNKAERLRMIRDYVWAANAKDKQSLAESLKRLEAGIPA